MGMAMKPPEEQTQMNQELQNNLLQLIQVVANNAKVQLEEKERENREAEEKRREEEEIAEIIRTQLTQIQKQEITDFVAENPNVSLDNLTILFNAKFALNIPQKVYSSLRNSGKYLEF